MPKAICNTSPLLYLYRIGAIERLPKLFDEVWTPSAVTDELKEGRQKGYDVQRQANMIGFKSSILAVCPPNGYH
jgi:hypothetical protein